MQPSGGCEASRLEPLAFSNVDLNELPFVNCEIDGPKPQFAERLDDQIDRLFAYRRRTAACRCVDVRHLASSFANQ